MNVVVLWINCLAVDVARLVVPVARPVALCVPCRHLCPSPRWRYNWVVVSRVLGRLRVNPWERQLVAVPTHWDLVWVVVPVGRLWTVSCIPRCLQRSVVLLECLIKRLFLMFIPLCLLRHIPLRRKVRALRLVTWVTCPTGLGPPGGPRPVSSLWVPPSCLLWSLTWSPDPRSPVRLSLARNPRLLRLEVVLFLGGPPRSPLTGGASWSGG